MSLELAPGVTAEVAHRLRELVMDGELTTEAVVRDARHEDSPLHHLFTWDDGAAAEAWRTWQARNLITRVKVLIIPADNSEPVRVRAYVSRRALGEGPEGYVPVEEIAGETDREIEVLNSIKRDIRRLETKYAGYEALLYEELSGLARHGAAGPGQVGQG